MAKRMICLIVDDDAFNEYFDNSGQVEEGTGVAYLFMSRDRHEERMSIHLEMAGVQILADKELVE